MTREELLTKFAAQRARKTGLTWGQFTAMFTSLGAPEKAQLLDAANKGDARLLFTIINGLVVAKKRELARAEIDLVAADDSLTIDELIAILG